MRTREEEEEKKKQMLLFFIDKLVKSLSRFSFSHCRYLQSMRLGTH